MNDQKPANPLVVTLLIVGIVGALGFALYRALAPAGTPPSTASPTSASAVALQPQPTAARKPERQPPAGENIAVGTNPFGSASASRSTRASTSPRPTAPPPPPDTGTLPAPLMVSRDRAQRTQALNAFAASDRTSSTGPGLPAPSAQPMPVTVEPELVGTLTGGQPTAVFKSDKAMVMVPQGGVYMGWRVLRVSHTEATIWNGNITLRLRIGAPSAPAARTATAERPMIETNTTSDMIVVHYRSLPAPTRQDLVYGRIEDPAQFGRADEPQPLALPPSNEEAAPPSDPPDISDPEQTTTSN